MILGVQSVCCALTQHLDSHVCTSLLHSDSDNPSPACTPASWQHATPDASHARTMSTQRGCDPHQAHALNWRTCPRGCVAGGRHTGLSTYAACKAVCSPSVAVCSPITRNTVHTLLQPSCQCDVDVSKPTNTSQQAHILF